MANSSSYDNLPFESFPSPERGIWRLESLAKLHGHSSVPARNARVLDIGCGSATLLLTMASELPEASFVGIDSSGSHLERAESFRKSLRLSNVQFIKASIEEYSPAQNSFDYIFAYGMFSWLQPDSQRKLLQLISNSLSSDGLSAISFNPWPGFHSRNVLRKIAARCIDPALSEEDSVHKAREAFGRIFNQVMDTSTPHSEYLRSEIGFAAKQADPHLYYTLLSPTVTSIPLGDLIEELKSHGLTYLTDARPRNWRAVRHVREYKDEDREKGLQGLAKDMVELEVLLDLIQPASFRTAVVRKQVARETGTFSNERFKGMIVASPLVERESMAPSNLRKSTFYTPAGTEIPITSNHLDNVLRTLQSAWPRGVPVDSLIENRTVEETTKICDQLMIWFLDELVEMDVAQGNIAVNVADMPVAYPLARKQAETQEWVTTARHGYITVDLFSRAILTLCDGTRALAAIVQGLIDLKGGELPPEVTVEDLRTATTEVLEHFLESALLIEKS